MTISPVRARCVNCNAGFRFKRNKSGTVVRNMLQVSNHWPLVTKLDDGKIGCLCRPCLEKLANADERRELLTSVTEIYGQFTPLNKGNSNDRS